VSRILIITSIFPPEPVVSALLSKDIAEALSTKHEVIVLCPEPSRPAGFAFGQKMNPDNYEIKYAGSFICPESRLFGRFRESYSFGKYCSKFIKENSTRIDCIYINSWPLLSQYKIIKTAKRCQIPAVIHIQDIYPESLTNKMPWVLSKLVNLIFLPLDKYILKNSNLIIGISPSMISYLSETRKIKKEKFGLVRNWQDDNQFLTKAVSNYKRSKQFTFMYAGSISASAGVAVLIHSFHIAGLTDAKLVIAGNGAEKEKCKNIAAQLQNNNIEFRDIIPEEVACLQAQADILLLSLRKGIAKTATPSKLTAYLLSSKPVIATVESDSDVANILINGNCGFIVEPEDEGALSAILKKSYEMSDTELEKMGANGKEYARINLSKEANLSIMVSIIEKTANAN